MTTEPAARSRFRHLTWMLFVLALTGLGVGLHFVLPPTPRWTIQVKDGLGVPAVSSDGKIFLRTVPQDNSYPGGLYEAWDIASGQLLHRFAPEPAESPGFISHDFRYIAVPLAEHKVTFADMVEGREWTITLSADAGWVYEPLYLPVAGLFPFLETSDRDVNSEINGKLHIVRASTGNVLATIPLHSSLGSLLTHDIRLSPGEELLSYRDGYADGTPLTIWSTRTRQVLRTLPEIGTADAWSFSADGTAVTALLYDRSDPPIPKEFVRWELQTGDRHGIPIPPECGCFLSPDRRILVGFNLNVIRAWDAIDLTELCTVTFRHGVQAKWRDVLQGNLTLFGFGQSAAAFSPDCRSLLVPLISENSELFVARVDLRSGKILWEKSDYLQLYKDGRFLIIGPVGFPERIFNAADGQFLEVYSKNQQFQQTFAKSDYLLAGQMGPPPAPMWEQMLGGWSPFPRIIPDQIFTLTHIATKAEIFRIHSVTPLALEYLSRDGRMLITSSSIDILTYAAWDIPTRPRWGWIVGLPAVLGLVGIAIRYCLLLFRRRQIQIAAASAGVARNDSTVLAKSE